MPKDTQIKEQIEEILGVHDDRCFTEDYGCICMRWEQRDALMDLFHTQQTKQLRELRDKLVDGLTLDLVVIAVNTPPEQVVSEIAKKLKELKGSDVLSLIEQIGKEDR